MVSWSNVREALMHNNNNNNYITAQHDIGMKRRKKLNNVIHILTKEKTSKSIEHKILCLRYNEQLKWRQKNTTNNNNGED